MADAPPKPRGEDAGEIGEPPLPEGSVLSLGEYLDMQAAIGNLTRYRILRTLVHHDQASATSLGEALDLDGNTLHYHLDTLVDVGLVDKRKRKTADQDGLYSYYRPTPMGEAILDHGIEELIEREAELLDAYS